MGRGRGPDSLIHSLSLSLPIHVSDSSVNSQDGSIFRMQGEEGCGLWHKTNIVKVSDPRDFFLSIETTSFVLLLCFLEQIRFKTNPWPDMEKQQQKNARARFVSKQFYPKMWVNCDKSEFFIKQCNRPIVTKVP